MSEKYKGFLIEKANGVFIFHDPDKEDGTGDRSGWSFTVEDAKEQIDDILDEEEGEKWIQNNLANSNGI